MQVVGNWGGISVMKFSGRILCAVFDGVLNVRAESMSTRSLVFARCIPRQSIKPMPV